MIDPDLLRPHARWMDSLLPDQVRRVCRDAAAQHVPAGSAVARRGEVVDHWTGVLGGLVKLVSTGSDGRATTFTGIPPGGWFGEGSLLKREPRRYDAVALSGVTVARLPQATFEWLLDGSIAFNRYLLLHLNERLSQFIGMVEHERLLDPDARMARCIAHLFNPVLYPGLGERLEISQAELAQLAGVSRQRANRSLQALERAGVVAVGYGSIRVLDTEGLRRFGT